MEFFIVLFSICSALTFGIGGYLFVNKVSNNVKNKTNDKNYVIIVSFFLFSICAFFLAITINHLNTFIIDAIRIKTDYTKVGAYGDLIGGILNPVVAFIGIVAASLAFYAQYRANTQVQKQFRVQQFESKFYEMLRLHKENINEMKITGYGTSVQESIEYEKEEEDYKEKNKIRTEVQTTRITEGRKVFVTMVTELIAVYEFLEFYNILYKTSISKKELLNFAYKVFFFGVKSDIPSSEVILIEDIEKFKRHLNNIRSRHKESNGKNNLFQRQDMKSVELYIKYSPFSGHESRLGHYYRHLYSTVKFVVSEENKLFTYK
jgi:hypothetical protein